MSFMEGLMKEVNGTVAEATTTKTGGGWYACEACHKSYQSASAEDSCPICGEKVRQWVGNTQIEAIERMQKSVKLQETQPEPKQEPVADEREALWKQLDAMGIKYSKRMKAQTLTKLITAYKASPVTPTVTPVATNCIIEPKEEEPEVIEETKQAEPVKPITTDYKEIRRKATDAFIKKHKLNEISPVKVGTAEVQLIGFTIWQDKKPAFRFMQPFESPEMFQKVYNESRAVQPSCAIDVVQCNNATNEELKACLYNGNLVVSLNNGNGTTIARTGEVVEVGALKTASNHIRFVALKVIRS